MAGAGGRIGVALLFLAVPALALAAAPPKPQAAARSSPEAHADVFGGYGYTHAGEAGLHGWQLTVSVPFRDRWRLVADLGGRYGSFATVDLRQLEIFGGLRYVLRSRSRLSPFGQALLGAVRRKTSVDVGGTTYSESNTDFGSGLGAGLDYRVGRSWAARAQADWLLVRSAGQWEGDPRFAVGAVYRFGR